MHTHIYAYAYMHTYDTGSLDIDYRGKTETDLGQAFSAKRSGRNGMLQNNERKD